MEKGKVKWFNNARGYGFINVDNIPGDILVHHSVIQGNGFKTLYENQDVEVDYTQSQKGLVALKVIAKKLKK